MRLSGLARNLRLGVKDLLLHKLRSFLTMLGVVFGVGSVVAMLAVGEGASNQALAEIRKLGSQNILISSVKPLEEESGWRPTMVAVYGLLYDDETRIRETIPGVLRTVPVRLLRRDGAVGERRMEARIVATTPGWFDLVRRDVIAGRVLAAGDEDRVSPVCVLTETGARRLLAGAHTIGERVRLGTDLFEVVGIVRGESGGGAIEPPDQEHDVYISLAAAQRLFGGVSVRQTQGSREMERVELHRILVEVDSVERVETVAAAIEALLRRFHRKSDYRVSVPLALLRQAEATKRTFNIVLGSIAGISLLVGGIGIMNIMLASVTERTREIGVRRAIGARRRQIIAQFLIETMVLSGVGGVVGIAMGMLIPRIVTRFTGLPTVVPFYSLALSFGISVAVGIVFGLYPALRAARLDPIVALRHE